MTTVSRELPPDVDPDPDTAVEPGDSPGPDRVARRRHHRRQRRQLVVGVVVLAMAVAASVAVLGVRRGAPSGEGQSPSPATSSLVGSGR